MKQMIFDYFCDLANDPEHPLQSDDVWEAHEYAFEKMDLTEFWDQCDRLLDTYFTLKA